MEMHRICQAVSVMLVVLTMTAPGAAQQAVWKDRYVRAEALAASHQWADAYQAATGIAEAAERDHPQDRLKAAKYRIS